MADASQSVKARFITFEGGEGVGKSTQAKRLQARLHKQGIEAIRTREPGGTPKAEAIRSFILQGRSESWGAGAEAVLFAAARLDHVNQLIAPNLDAGKWVISDRFHDSTRAYQGLTGGVDAKLIGALEELALNGHKPDLTLVLDMDPEIAFARVRERQLEDALVDTGDRFEKENLEWHRKLREGFLEIARNNRERCVVVLADRTEDKLEEAIWQAVLEHFPELETAPTA
ncbi:thymidylate kinase [Youhaiella tibetensis]|uniref:Thymidylate kinase n=1 Tax=Paradevosia tibetensis TaxID=1447062 RepID=A0A5B9DMR5_9HYPH|nr:dTMP kinase [Youhaiella tibetensis]AKR55488.1 Thymidylate kinase [Devosia sp. H5989]QEE20620.1 dTMP kinase [Youhaiella tibetensis]GGF22574.1 thymidylate kinase [Youhaiella tibetensis]